MKRFAIFAAMLAIAASCTINEIEGQPEINAKPSLDSGKSVKAPDITAAFGDNSTKSTITTDSDGVGTIWWTPADEINVFYDTTSTHYTSQNTENTTSAVFKTEDEISEEALAKTNIWGLYPYDAAAECNGSSVTTTIPASQKAIAGSFDEELFTSLAHSTNNEMTFYNVLGGIKFSLSRDDIRSITFKGNNNEDIAGKVCLSMSTDGTPAASVSEGVKTITLTPKEGTCFDKDTYFYILMLPVELTNGFTMLFETGTDLLVLESSTGVLIKRSVFKRAAEIDKRATAMPPLTISGDGFTVSLKQTGSPEEISLEYRFGDGDWKPYVIGTELPATTLAESCYSNMFSGCTKLTEAPYLPAVTLASYCYSGMFFGCTSLESISVEFTDWKVKSSTNYPETDNWLKNASTTGTFYCPSTLDATSTRSTSYVPSGWEVPSGPFFIETFRGH